MNTSEILDQLKRTMDEADELNARLNTLRSRRKHLENKLLQEAERSGLTSFSSDTMTVTVKEDFIAAYEPEKWNELLAWAVNTGNMQVVQRRVNTKPIIELIDQGIEIPDGVRLEPMVKILARRK